MKWVRGLSLAFGVPVVLIVGGIVWGPLMEWDLTQPQATLIAGLVAGPFLITAAYIAFRGQRENMTKEREKFDEQIRLQKEQARDELQLRRDQWVAEQRLTNARNVRDRDSALFARVLAFYAEFARAVGRTKRAIPDLPVSTGDSSWTMAKAHFAEVVTASNDKNDFVSELRLAGHTPSEIPLNHVHTAMRRLRESLREAIASKMQDAALRAHVDPVQDEFSDAVAELTARAVEALRRHDEDVLELANALEIVDRSTDN